MTGLTARIATPYRADISRLACDFCTRRGGVSLRRRVVAGRFRWGGCILRDQWLLDHGPDHPRHSACGQFSLLTFYDRRIRRIIPALFVMLVVTTVLGYFMLYPGDYAIFAKSALYAAFGASNFFLHANTGYFDRAAEFQPLLHTWSMGVEEQFYVAWPALLAGVAYIARGRKAWIVLLVAPVYIVSIACERQVAVIVNPKARFRSSVYSRFGNWRWRHARLAATAPAAVWVSIRNPRRPHVGSGELVYSSQKQAFPDVLALLAMPGSRVDHMAQNPDHNVAVLGPPAQRRADFRSTRSLALADFWVSLPDSPQRRAYQR